MDRPTKPLEDAPASHQSSDPTRLVPGPVASPRVPWISGYALSLCSLTDVAARKRARLLALDRPGYGQSTYDPARNYESWARDVDQLADHLGIERFAVIGHSSGGPNAAGYARFLGDRLVACAIVSGPAPPEAKISKHAMLRMNRITQRLAPVTPRLLSLAFAAGLRANEIPRATLHEIPHEGHWLVYDHFEEILDCVAA